MIARAMGSRTGGRLDWSREMGTIALPIEIRDPAWVAKLVDAPDSKSGSGNRVWVRFPPQAPITPRPSNRYEPLRQSVAGARRVISTPGTNQDKAFQTARFFHIRAWHLKWAHFASSACGGDFFYDQGQLSQGRRPSSPRRQVRAQNSKNLRRAVQPDHPRFDRRQN